MDSRDIALVISDIKDNHFYKLIMADSFGGIMYNVANKNKYDEGKETLLALYSKIEKYDVADGIVKGAMRFLKRA